MTFGNNTYKGFFKPQNPLKYKGDPSNIVFRSSWELRVMKYFDEHPSVIWWASEELPIKYLNPIDKRYHRYFPDFIVKMQQKDGKVMTYVLEVKPYDQTQQPKQRRKTQKYLQESATFIINQSKWQAADIFCKEHGWIFKVITERDLNL